MSYDLTDVEMIFTEPCRGKPDDNGKLGTEWRVVGITGPPGTDDNYRVFLQGEPAEVFRLKVELQMQLDAQR
jgi:hypothetical protein